MSHMYNYAQMSTVIIRHCDGIFIMHIMLCRSFMHKYNSDYRYLRKP